MCVGVCVSERERERESTLLVVDSYVSTQVQGSRIHIQEWRWSLINSKTIVLYWKQITDIKGLIEN